MNVPAHAVVTGGAGFLGSWLCERLLAGGASVACVDSLVTGSLDNVAHLRGLPGFRFVEADVSAGIPVDGPVDAVFHLASPASPLHYQRLPLETLRAGSHGTGHALDLAARHGARFVLASSSEVYGDPEQHPQRETYRGRVDPTGPRSMYDESKRFAEALTVAHRDVHGTRTGIARIFNTYGPRMAVDDGRLVPTLMVQALTGEPLTIAGDGSQTRSLCWVGDLVDGLVRLAASDESGPVNLGSDDERSVREVADVILRVTGSSSPVRHVPRAEQDPLVRRPDLARARTRLSWTPTTPLRTGLARTAAWYADRLAGAAATPMGA
ncbi:NAD-dependent epimerase/dehydratase family protein [Nocardioides sp. BYT-33-1]|uniref:NAD-dependent epimerase/dehydratase family protein n=1 Tax=Nocardioides sp. BYT-33-1 TaxID=3416952 RepID=UPI003F53D5B2